MSEPAISPQRPALIVIDVQRGFDDAQYWGPRDNLDCERNISTLLAHWRDRQWPVVFVQHDSGDPDSPLAPASAGHEFKDVVTGSPDVLVRKSVNSSFYGTPDLDHWLRSKGIEQVVICGITTNHCCETTARMAGNLGYETYFAIDATHTFDRASPEGETVCAATLSTITATNLGGEFATVLRTAALLDVLAGPGAEQAQDPRGHGSS
ncbi:cysteine hydrolase family protein [Nesterenkonia sp. Act20]|uniref:cysteine hydrolase family protein n=1 Tax=Nesterenkonia sp. Act20 TaxID=1483432 RepID=UPI001C48AB60|nr:cysteine hydrolase family protein [Nesterenkonia sp. Act20]